MNWHWGFQVSLPMMRFYHCGFLKRLSHNIKNYISPSLEDFSFISKRHLWLGLLKEGKQRILFEGKVTEWWSLLVLLTVIWKKHWWSQSYCIYAFLFHASLLWSLKIPWKNCLLLRFLSPLFSFSFRSCFLHRASITISWYIFFKQEFRKDWLSILMIVTSARSSINIRHLEKATVSTGKEGLLSEGNAAYNWSRYFLTLVCHYD